MKILLSLPPNLVQQGHLPSLGGGGGGPTIFHDITGLSPDRFFCTCDPEGHRIGSGGGTAWLLQQAYQDEKTAASTASSHDVSAESPQSFEDWLAQERRILIHAGGQSRRLPSYAPSGKILTPIPVLRWERGQRLSQDLLAMQLPLYEQLMQMAPTGLNTMVVSGDVLIRTTEPLSTPSGGAWGGLLPQADVVCLGLWLDASVATHHGVFVSDRSTPQVLRQMLQKPSVERLQELQRQHYYLTDIGVWLLSDRAVRLLMKRCTEGTTQPQISEGTAQPQIENRKSVARPEGTLLQSEATKRNCKYYDLYSDFGRALGTDPEIDDPELRTLSVAVVPLPGGEFYHFGTSREMISSTLALQNRVADQRLIMHNDRKPHPSIFVQNALLDISFTAENRNVWVENSHVGRHWTLTHDHVITGVPRNNWTLTLSPGQCIDVVPIGEDRYAVRLYHIDDRFDGAEQQRPQFPVLRYDEIEAWLNRAAIDTSAAVATDPVGSLADVLSAEQLSAQANLYRLFAQREEYRRENWTALAANWQHSVFYQLDLGDAARQFAAYHLPLPPALGDDAPLMTRIHDAMFRDDSQLAFSLLREGLTERVLAKKTTPRLGVCHDQIVWARSPVRIDIAGGWTDTPPYCLLEGGNVVNLAIDLNGQQPIQAYVKPSERRVVTLRSIDLGASEVVSTYDELMQFSRVGGPFSIPKAALALAGFAPRFSARRYPSLEAQLEDFGAGIELTMLSAIPAGSGLGTSSVLAATVLGALSDFCSLAWDKNEVCLRTLVLEQLLTTGGGWQDQLGGVLSGVKLLQTQPGFDQHPMARWLPSDLYTQADYRQCHLLYYTGITRTAKQILSEIVRRMFLNDHDQLLMLRQMKEHAQDMYEALQLGDFELMGRLVGKTWQQNQRIDAGTNPDGVRQLTNLIDDYCLGYKLPGAGGGGYLYMVAKDPEAAGHIRQILTERRLNSNARFVDMSLSATGMQISRS